MDKKNTGRLNQLFEKMVASAITAPEKSELTALYSHFIDEGRTMSANDHVITNNRIENVSGHSA